MGAGNIYDVNENLDFDELEYFMNLYEIPEEVESIVEDLDMNFDKKLDFSEVTKIVDFLHIDYSESQQQLDYDFELTYSLIGKLKSFVLNGNILTKFKENVLENGFGENEKKFLYLLYVSILHELGRENFEGSFVNYSDIKDWDIFIEEMKSFFNFGQIFSLEDFDGKYELLDTNIDFKALYSLKLEGNEIVYEDENGNKKVFAKLQTNDVFEKYVLEDLIKKDLISNFLEYGMPLNVMVQKVQENIDNLPENWTLEKVFSFVFQNRDFYTDSNSLLKTRVLREEIRKKVNFDINKLANNLDIFEKRELNFFNLIDLHLKSGLGTYFSPTEIKIYKKVLYFKLDNIVDAPNDTLSENFENSLLKQPLNAADLAVNYGSILQLLNSDLSAEELVKQLDKLGIKFVDANNEKVRILLETFGGKTLLIQYISSKIENSKEQTNIKEISEKQKKYAESIEDYRLTMEQLSAVNNILLQIFKLQQKRDVDLNDDTFKKRILGGNFYIEKRYWEGLQNYFLSKGRDPQKLNKLIKYSNDGNKIKINQVNFSIIQSKNKTL